MMGLCLAKKTFRAAGPSIVHSLRLLISTTISWCVDDDGALCRHGKFSSEQFGSCQFG